MATTVDEIGGPVRPRGRGYMADQGFFVRYAVFLAVFILFGFAQFAARGYSSFSTAPAIVHLHGGLMVAWLGIFIAQNLLVHKGQLGIHRKLGWISAALVVIVAVTGVEVGRAAIDAGRQPPFFSPAYFLVLTSVGSILFAAMVWWAIALRRNVQWHRRMMLGSMFILLEPAFGRLLPMPLLGGWGETIVLGFQLIFTWVLARHDRKVLGEIHPATIAVAVVLVASHALVELLAVLPPVQALAAAVAAS